MSTPKTEATPGVLIAAMVCGTVVLIALTAGLVALVRLAPAGTDVVPILTAVGVGAAAIIGQVVTYLKTRQVSRGVDYLANGGTDAKIRAGIADVIDPRYLKPDVDGQLAADRAHRSASPAYKDAPPTQPS